VEFDYREYSLSCLGWVVVHLATACGADECLVNSLSFYLNISARRAPTSPTKITGHKGLIHGSINEK
jgi:hypothetical protein